ncbi:MULTISPECIES: hypothetical protein [Bacillus amyloliquefaciens group]|uniref:hypothetical protein n=1 Tax=Bacillus amyloliquefaciens group TaxID=1938374 RepID=UPI00210AE6B4|nr:hypothetical protein [Bacillus amyloliquefaciens]UUA78627.1 hypothetical protein NO220_08620 [Bacillus amyloliquefaciens]
MGIIDINFYLQSDNVQAVKNIFLNPSLWGSLAGATLSSSAAILIMWLNAERDKKTKRKDKLEEFLVEAVFFRDSVNLLIEHMDAYASVQHILENSPRGDISHSLKRQLTDLKEHKKINEKDILRYLTYIKSVDRTKFSFEYYQHYFKIKYICENDLEFFWDRSMKYDISGAAEIILKAIKDLKIELNKLNEIISAREIEFKKIK